MKTNNYIVIVFCVAVMLLGAGCINFNEDTTRPINLNPTNESTVYPSIEHRYLASPKNSGKVLLTIKTTETKPTTAEIVYGIERITHRFEGVWENSSITLEELNAEGKKVSTLKGELDSAHILSAIWKDELTQKEKSFEFKEIYTDAPGASDFTGHYEFGENYIDSLLLDPGKVKIQGYAEWIGENKNIHYGDFAEIATIEENVITISRKDGCVLSVTYAPTSITVQDNKKCGGSNVSFDGEYIKRSENVLDWTLFSIDQ